MAQSGYTPIQLYYSTTGGATPTAGNLSNGELAINITDGKLFYKNGTNVYTIASKATSATTGTNVQLLANDGSGGFSNVTVGSGLSYSGGTLSASGGGTVTSVALSGGTTGLTVSGSPITTSGTITLAGTVATTNGGTGLTSFTANGVVYASSTSALATGSALTFDGTNLGIGTSSPAAKLDVNGTAIISGSVGIGTALSQVSLYNTRNITGNVNSFGNYTQATIQSDVTTAAYGYRSNLSTVASAFTVGAIYNFYSGQGTIGAGSAVTNQYGYVADSSLTGATNNYGFYSNIASGTGRWNFYAAGSAYNYFAGNTGFGSASPTAAVQVGMTMLASSTSSNEYGLYIQQSARNASGTASKYGTSSRAFTDTGWAGTGGVMIGVEGYSAHTVTGTLNGAYSFYSTVGNTSTGTIGNVEHFKANNATNSGGGTITTQIGFRTGVLSSATNNYGVYSEIASGANQWNFYANGTADNYFAGNVGIGLTPVANNGILQLNSYASVQAMMEKATVSATAATGTINFDAATQAVLYYTTNSSGNWTINIRGSSGLTLNNMMQTGQSLTLAFMATNGSTAYYQSALTIDGSSVTPKWQGGTAPTAGNASAIDAYVLTVIKTGSATFTVLASQTKFA